MSSTLAERLNRLFDIIHPPGRGSYSSADVIAALRAEGITMSAPYLSQLRSGKRTHPSPATRPALADFFGVEQDYFTDDDYYERIGQELAWLSLTRDEDVRRVTTDIAALSPSDRQRVHALIDQLRQARRHHDKAKPHS